MADQQKAEKKINERETTKKKLKAEAKAAEPEAAEVGSRPAATASVASPKRSMKKGKLLPKNKHRLPRLQKKAQHKAAGRL